MTMLVLPLVVVLVFPLEAVPTDLTKGIVELDASREGSTYKGDIDDSFRLLHLDSNHILIGARGAVYNLSSNDLTLHNRIVWPTKDSDVKDCINLGHPREKCANFIRVYAEQRQGKVVFCGTNAYSPLCTEYDHVKSNIFNHYEPRRTFSGIAVAPYDPNANSTFTYLPETGDVYTGTHSDPEVQNHLIHRTSLVSNDGFMRTPRDLTVLNEPHFVMSSNDHAHVYFWFREIADEKTSPCGKGAYSRVARVCRKDKGRGGNHEWTSFTKARLTCSIPGTFPFMFDELQSATLVDTRTGDQMIYGIFTTPWEGLRATAVCAYRMQGVQTAFDHSPPRRKGRKTKGPCGESNAGGTLMNPIRNFFRQPLFVDTSMNSKFTKIAVETSVQAVDGHEYDVVYLATAQGTITKLVNVAPKRSHGVVEPVVVERLSVTRGQAIRELKVQRGEEGSSLLIVTDSQVRQIPAQHCRNMSTCTGCLRLKDPHCAWQEGKGCVSRPKGGWDRDVHVQDLHTGESSMCPKGEQEPLVYYINGEELYPQPSIRVNSAVFKTRDLAIAVCASMICAVVVGFMAGYFIRFRFNNPFIRSTASSVTYDSTSHSLIKYPSHMCNQLDVYGTTPQHTKLNEAVSLMLQEACMRQDGKPTTPEKNHLQEPALLNNGTLPKDYKVKRVYV